MASDHNEGSVLVSGRVLEILKRLAGISNVVSQTIAYKKYWSAEFCAKEIEETFSSFEKYIQETWDLTEFGHQELQDLGFRKWSKNTSIFLIPLHFFGCLRNGTALTSIDGKQCTIGTDDIDLDIRGGLIAFGWAPVDYVASTTESAA